MPEATSVESSPSAAQGKSGSAPGAGASRGAWLALTAALLGWMFDGAEMGSFSLVSRPAVRDLLSAGTTDPVPDGDIGLWIGMITGIFLVGAATGGVLFGWLGDRIGRVRAMTLSVLTYAVFTSLCGFSQTPVQLGAMRFIASLGMGGEWSLGVALVMEVWPNRSRAFMAGLIGAAANVGYLLVGLVGVGLTAVISKLKGVLLGIGLGEELATRLVANDGWRIIMILGIVPALLTFFIRLFVPESHKWEEEKSKGSTSHWATADLLGVLIGAIGPAVMVYLYALPKTGSFEHTAVVRIIATVLGVALALAGYTYPVLRYLQRLRASGGMRDEAEFGVTMRRLLLAACLSGVALLGTWGGTQQAPAWVDKLAEPQKAAAKEAGEKIFPKENTLIWLSVGAIVGTIGAAMMGDWLGRRKAYFLLCVASLASVLLLFQTNTEYGPRLLFCAFVSGTCTASFYGWLPLYLPEIFRTNVRATGQGFGFNFGRVLAAVGTFQIGNLLTYFSKGISIGGWQLPGGYPTACTLLSMVYLVGMGLIWIAPETRGKPLPE